MSITIPQLFFIILCLCSSIIAGYYYFLPNTNTSTIISLVCKSLPAFLLAILTIIIPLSLSNTSSLPPSNSKLSLSCNTLFYFRKYTTYTCGTLIICGIADILIDINFIFGLLCFLISHGMYILLLYTYYIIYIPLTNVSSPIPTSNNNTEISSIPIVPLDSIIKHDGIQIHFKNGKRILIIISIFYILLGIILSSILFYQNTSTTNNDNTNSNNNNSSNTELPPRLITIPILIIGIIIYMLALLTINILSLYNLLQTITSINYLYISNNTIVSETVSENVSENVSNTSVSLSIPSSSSSLSLSNALLSSPSSSSSSSISKIELSIQYIPISTIFILITKYPSLFISLSSTFGTIFFLISDTCLAFSLFVNKLGNTNLNNSLIIMLTYWIALLGYTISALLHSYYYYQTILNSTCSTSISKESSNLSTGIKYQNMNLYMDNRNRMCCKRKE